MTASDVQRARPPSVAGSSAERQRLLNRRCADPAIRLLRSCGWTTVADPDANVYCASPDGRVFVG